MRSTDWLRLCVVLSLLAGVQSQSAGQPPVVNNRTLNCFLPIEVVGEPVPIYLNYNSYSGERTAFGQKWRSGLFPQVLERAVFVTVMESDGFQNSYVREADRDRPEQEVFVEAIIEGLRAADRSTGGERTATTYEQERSRLLRDQTARSSAIEAVLGGAKVPPGRYISVARGESALNKDIDGTFRRLVRDGTTEMFDSLGQPVQSSDGKGNSFRLEWRDGLIRRLRSTSTPDAALVQFQYNDEGLMTEIAAGASAPQRITYNPSGMIATIMASDGTSHEFAYDPIGNLTRYKRSTGASSDEWILSYNKKYEVEQVKHRDFTTKYARSSRADSQESTTTIELLERDSLKSRVTKRYDSRALLSTAVEFKDAKQGDFTLRLSFRQPGNVLDRVGVDGVGEMRVPYRQDGSIDQEAMSKLPSFDTVADRWNIVFGESNPLSRAPIPLME